MKLRANETITVTPTHVSAASKVPLMNDDGTDINERAKFIFDQMFHTYAIDDPDDPSRKVMRIQEICNFITGATHETCDISDHRAVEILKAHDTDGDGRLVRDDFVEFYRQACFNKITTVRNNLFKYNYNNQLKRMPKDGDDVNIMQPRKDISEMPRHKIARDNSCFDTLFSL
jgi:hypothetical protein